MNATRLVLPALIALSGQLAACDCRDEVPVTREAPQPEPVKVALADGSEVDISDLPADLRRCLERTCAGSASEATFATCRSVQCEREGWSVAPTSLRYDPETGQLTVAASVRHRPGRAGGEEVERTRPAYVGATAITASGEEIDLAIQTLFPERLSSDLLFMSEVGPGVQDIIFGVWDRQVSPCDDSRSGCQKFGFLLDGSLATWPPTIYQDGVRQRVLPAQVTFQPIFSGSDVAAYRAALDKARQTLTERLAPFHATIAEAPVALSEAPRPGVTWTVRHDHDAWLAGMLAGPFRDGTTAVDEGAGQDFAFRHGTQLGRDAWRCARASCGDATDLLACVEAQCEGTDR